MIPAAQTYKMTLSAQDTIHKMLANAHYEEKQQWIDQIEQAIQTAANKGKVQCRISFYHKKDKEKISKYTYDSNTVILLNDEMTRDLFHGYAAPSLIALIQQYDYKTDYYGPYTDSEIKVTSYDLRIFWSETDPMFSCVFD